jgi:hypothetical protein
MCCLFRRALLCCACHDTETTKVGGCQAPEDTCVTRNTRSEFIHSPSAPGVLALVSLPPLRFGLRARCKQRSARAATSFRLTQASQVWLRRPMSDSYMKDSDCSLLAWLHVCTAVPSRFKCSHRSAPNSVRTGNTSSDVSYNVIQTGPIARVIVHCPGPPVNVTSTLAPAACVSLSQST